MQRFRGIDIFVNNAGYLSEHVAVSESPLDDRWKGFEINVKGSLVVTQAFLKVAKPNATVINGGSEACHIRYIPGYSGYAASKLAMVKIIEYLQLANPHLRVFNLQPGAIASDMSQKAGDIPTSDSID